MPTLFVLQGPDKGHTFEINNTPTLIGRNSQDVPLADSTISRKHAELTKENNAWYIRDLNSANGIYVNGVKIEYLTLKLGDQIRCGASLLVFGGVRTSTVQGMDHNLEIDENGNMVESTIMTKLPSSEDSIIMADPETSDAVNNLRVLYELSNAIGSIFDRDQLLEEIMDMIFINFPVDRGFMMLSDAPDQKLEPIAVRFRSEEDSGKITISRTIVNEVMLKQEAIICTNATRDPRFTKGDSVHDYGIHSALCVPISVRDRHFGVIYIDTMVANNTYTSDQLRLLNAIGAQTAMALEHARLYAVGIKSERLAAAGETVSYLSHGIKNILQSLQSAADLVEIGLNRNKIDTAKKGWTILHRNMTRIQNLVLNMLAFSKVREPNRSMTQVNTILTECIELLSTQADERKIALVTDLDDQMPAVPIDADGIQQVILNLLLNALGAVDENRGIITVKAYFEELDSEVYITITDNGTGIDEEQIERIWTPFESNKGHGGTGIGLAVVKKIIEEHKGRVKVTSELDVGTTFTLILPTVDVYVTGSGGTAGPGLHSQEKNWLFPRR
jgi:two-component system NtrC family sensor kinase